MSEETVKSAPNPLLKKLSLVPAEYFYLPSQGIFYSSGELDPECENGQIAVYPMTSIDELELKSADLLYTGDAIVNVINRRVPHIKKPWDLLALDVDYILTCLRKVSYGNHIPIRHKCTGCGENAQEHEYLVPTSELINKAKPFDKEKYKDLNFKIGGFSVSVTPLTLKELINIFKLETSLRSKDNMDINDIDEAQATAMCSVIKKVDNVDDRAQIKEWLKALPKKYKDQISKKLVNLNDWGMSFEYEIHCKDCDKTEKIQIVSNPTQLFTIPSSPEIENV